MKPKDTKTFGMISSLFAGVFFSVTLWLAFKMPVSIMEVINSEEFELIFSYFQRTFMSLKLMILLSNLSMMGVVVTFYLLVRDKRDPTILWGTILAILGLGVGMLQALMDMYIIPFTVSQLYEGTEVVRAFLLDLGVANPYMYILSAGFPAIWLFIVSLKHKINCYIPIPLRVVSFAWGCILLALVIVQALSIFSLLNIVSLLGIFIAPIWTIWLGIFFFKRVQHLSQIAHHH